VPVIWARALQLEGSLGAYGATLEQADVDHQLAKLDATSAEPSHAPAYGSMRRSITVASFTLALRSSALRGLSDSIIHANICCESQGIRDPRFDRIESTNNEAGRVLYNVAIKSDPGVGKCCMPKDRSREEDIVPGTVEGP